MSFTPVPADTLYLNGKIYTADAADRFVRSVAVKDGMILAAGTEEELRPFRGENTRIIDLAGRTVLPGFIDVHNHYGQMSIAHFFADAGPWAGVSKIADIQALIRSRAREGEGWITVTNYDETRLAEGRHPLKAEIDEACADRPVIVTHISGHMALINSCGLKALGLDETALDRPSGRYGREADGKTLSGLVYGDAFWRLSEDWPPKITPPDTETIKEGMKRVGAQYTAAGITSLCDIVAWPWTIRAYMEMWRAGELPLRVAYYVRNYYMDAYTKTGLLPGFGDDMLKFAGIKFFIDGGMSSGTAAVSDSEGYRTPTFIYTQEEVDAMILQIHEAGQQVAVHCNGDIAVRMYLNAMEKALAACPRENHRHRIEHCSVVDPEIIERIKKAGVLPTLFATMPWFHGAKVKRFINPEKEKWLFPFRSMLNAGINVPAHSDYPTNPYPPLLGISSQVNRRTRDGDLPIGPEQAITVTEAVRTWTRYAAYATFDEERKGSIEPGKLADFVILGRDIFTVPKETIADIPVEMTVIGDRIVYEKEE